jgi:hypothetical protein
LVSLSSFGQNIELEDSIRVLFHQIETDSDIDEFLSFKTQIDSPIPDAYFGVATTMKAQYAFSPAKKLKLFSDGCTDLEKSIETNKCSENVYLRLMLQLNAPAFLGYHEKIQSDIDYFGSHITKSSLDPKWKKTMLNKILLSKSKKYDFSILEKILTAL